MIGVEVVDTFFNLFFSATSSFPAFCACRFSCLAVNLSWKRDFSRPDIVKKIDQIEADPDTEGTVD